MGPPRRAWRTGGGGLRPAAGGIPARRDRHRSGTAGRAGARYGPPSAGTPPGRSGGGTRARGPGRRCPVRRGPAAPPEHARTIRAGESPECAREPPVRARALTQGRVITGEPVNLPRACASRSSAREPPERVREPFEHRSAPVNRPSVLVTHPGACLHRRTRGDPSARAREPGERARQGARFCMMFRVRYSLTALAPLAQLAEQLTLNQRVWGSSPWRRTHDRPGMSVPGLIFSGVRRFPAYHSTPPASRTCRSAFPPDAFRRRGDRCLRGADARRMARRARDLPGDEVSPSSSPARPAARAACARPGGSASTRRS